MAHKRKDTLTAPPDWNKHFTVEAKKRISKSERQAAKQLIRKESNDNSRSY